MDSLQVTLLLPGHVCSILLVPARPRLFHNTTAQTPLIAPIDDSLEDVSDSAHIPPFDGSVGKLNRSAGS